VQQEFRALAACVAALALGCQRSEPAREGAAPSKPEVPAPPTSTPLEPAPAGPRAPAPPLPDPLPGARTNVTAIVGAAARVAIADLDGDGASELVLFDAAQIRVVAPSGRELARAPVTRGIQTLAVADLDHDGHAEVFAGWGQTRDHMDTRATFTVHRWRQGELVEETVLAPVTTRQDAVSIVPMPDNHAVLLAYFESKYMVHGVVATQDGSSWSVTPLATLRTATTFARGDLDGDGVADLVVGRVYGDDKGVDGDAFILSPDGTRRPIPTTRGLRSLAIADGDGDGHPEVFLGDGWHQNYGELARGLLTWARPSTQGFHTELIEDTAGQYAIERILPATIDGQTMIVTLGSSYVRVFRHAGGRWTGLTIAGLARDLAVGDLDGKPGDEILILGTESEIVNLRGIAWP